MSFYGFYFSFSSRQISVRAITDLPTPGKRENLETHEKRSGDSTINSEILFSPIKPLLQSSFHEVIMLTV